MRLLSMGLLSVVPERKHYSGCSALHAAFCGEMVQGLSPWVVPAGLCGHLCSWFLVLVTVYNRSVRHDITVVLWTSHVVRNAISMTLLVDIVPGGNASVYRPSVRLMRE